MELPVLHVGGEVHGPEVAGLAHGEGDFAAVVGYEPVGNQAVGDGLGQVVDGGFPGGLHAGHRGQEGLAVAAPGPVAQEGQELGLLLLLKEAHDLGEPVPVFPSQDELVLGRHRVLPEGAFAVRQGLTGCLPTLVDLSENPQVKEEELDVLEEGQAGGGQADGGVLFLLVDLHRAVGAEEALEEAHHRFSGSAEEAFRNPLFRGPGRLEPQGLEELRGDAVEVEVEGVGAGFLEGALAEPVPEEVGKPGEVGEVLPGEVEAHPVLPQVAVPQEPAQGHPELPAPAGREVAVLGAHIGPASASPASRGGHPLVDHGEGLGGQALLLGEESLAALHQDLLARPELPRFPVALRGQEEVVRGEGHLGPSRVRRRTTGLTPVKKARTAFRTAVPWPGKGAPLPPKGARLSVTR